MWCLMCVYNPSIWDLQGGGLQVQGKPRLQSKFEGTLGPTEKLFLKATKQNSSYSEAEECSQQRFSIANEGQKDSVYL